MSGSSTAPNDSCDDRASSVTSLEDSLQPEERGGNLPNVEAEPEHFLSYKHKDGTNENTTNGDNELASVESLSAHSSASGKDRSSDGSHSTSKDKLLNGNHVLQRIPRRISTQNFSSTSSSVKDDPLQHRRTMTEIPSTPTNTSWPSMFLEKFQLMRYQCGMFINHPKVQLLIVAMIAVNALMMGIGTFDFVEMNAQLNYAFDKTDHVFLILFTIELGLQFVYRGWRLISDGWLVFDMLVIIISWTFDSFQIIRAFRVLRALRLITRIKVMQNLVIALFGVVPRMFAIGMLLMLVSYIFAVMLTELFQDSYEDGLTEINYFGNLFRTLFTLFQFMTMDDWASSVRELSVEYPWAWFPIVVFVIITAFVVVNLIIAVICDAVSALHDDEKAKIHGTFESDEDQDTQDGSTASRYSLRKDLNAQLDGLEENVGELMRMQEETMIALRNLAEYIAEKQRRKSSKMRRSTISTKKSNNPEILLTSRRRNDQKSTKQSTSSKNAHHENSFGRRGSF
ncbi:cation channel sperm-associated protein 3 [Mayamaea pseudoterrestris]|nr:cation channel sperm-associated protein 3 [Mayamaea pseudoterrestris]